MSTTDFDAVRDDLKALMDNPDWDDGSYAPIFIRLAWHSSGTYSLDDGSGGSNGATMRYEKEASDPENNGLENARAFLDPIKTKYPTLSYSDLWILAAYVALEVTGGPVIEFTPGRKDKPASKAIAPGRLPGAEHGLGQGLDSEGRINGWENLAQHIRDVFYRMGFNDQEIVALMSGGHVYGRCHPNFSGYSGAWVEAPTQFSNEYAADLIEDEWMYVEHDTKVNGEPIPEETRPAPGKRQYMTKWEPTRVELQNASAEAYPPGRYVVTDGYINVRRTHLPDSYVIDQPVKNTEFDVVTVRKFGNGVRGQISVGGWVSILSTNGENELMKRKGDVELEPGRFRLLEGTREEAKLYSEKPVDLEQISQAASGQTFKARVATVDEIVILLDGKGFLAEVYGKVCEGEFKDFWLKLVGQEVGAVFEKIVAGYNETPRRSIKKTQVQYQMMLPADMVMLWDTKFCEHLKRYAEDEEVLKEEFGAAYKKLTELGVPGCPFGHGQAAN